MREFLRTGEFGPVKLGDSVDAIRNALGAPPVVGGTSRRQRTPGIWKYGDIEFHLSNDRQHLCLIFCDAFDRMSLGEGATLEHWFFDGHPSREAVEAKLAAAAIFFHRRDLPHEPTAYVLRLDSGVELLFSNGNNPYTSPGVPGLFGFQHAQKGPGMLTAD